MSADARITVVRLARKLGILRARDLAPQTIPRRILRTLTEEGVLIRAGRGLYTLADAEVTEFHSVALACKRVPAGVLCLLSALRFHDLTTQSPSEVWMALPPGARTPRFDHPPLRFFRFSGDALSEGVETHTVEGVILKVYSPAKTVADCFKYRNKIGVDVAVEALRETWRKRRATSDELWRFADVCRVSSVMRPYFESIS